MSEKSFHKELEQKLEELEQTKIRLKQTEEALRISEDRYRSVVEDLPALKERTRTLENILEKAADGICVCHNIPQEPYVKFTYWNPRMTEITGYTVEEINKLGWYQSLNPDPEVQRRAIERMNRMRKGDDIQSEEWMILTKSGENKHLSISSSIIKEEDDKTHVFVVMQDISKRKRAEAELRESEERLKHFYDAAFEGMAITDQGKIIDVNKRICEMYGYSREELIGSDVINLIAEDDRERVLNNIRSGYDKPYEHKSVHKNGSEVIVEVHGQQINYHGRPVRITAIHDITRRKRAEEALLESEKRYKNFIENAVIGIYQVTEDGQILMANNRMAEMLGYDFPEAFIEQTENITNLYARPEERAKILLEINEKGFIEGREVEFERKDGISIWVKLYTRVFTNTEGKSFYEGLIEDITDRKALEAQLRHAQKMEAIGTLAGGIAHDFNNILSPILIQTEMALLDLPPDSPIRFNLENVLEASHRARELVKQILALSRQSEEERHPIKIRPVVEDVLKLLRASLPTTIEIHRDLKSDPDTVLADPTQIHQVLMNLCTNAAHAMREKGGVLQVRLDNVEYDEEAAEIPDLNPGSYLRLAVSDTGVGMDHMTMERIFDPYYTTKKKGEGTGLGLAVVHGIIKSYGGAVTVESEPGKGTLFEVYLPYIETKDGLKAALEEPVPGGNETILLVDDETAIIEAIQQVLKLLGYQVIARTSSREALEVFRSRSDQIDLVITDQTMPNMTGEDLSRELLALRSDIPIILCTGFSETINGKKAETIGVREFIMKPIIISELGKTIRKALDRSK